ncbi:MAG: glycosyltransferase [Gammaproteobacteria bacterium]|nr:glycosyltransferase [Sideroxydans sp.]MBU3903135.1 glycosyltransferase [Gammaproteobacteria bacterium]MBU4044844.1 glycosyltransferase [Gammaproteobacteria bacterium]
MSVGPSVSLLIVCYNQQHFIREALESALTQDYANLEVVVADDASTDGTQAIIRELAQRYPHRLKPVFNPQNIGITANSNIGLSQCTGEFVAFMGGDDVLLPGKITRQVAWFAADDGRVLCGHDVDWIDAGGAPLGIRTSDLVPLREGRGASGFIRNGSPYAATSVMVRRSRIPAYGFHPALPVVSDWKLWIDVIGSDGTYGYIPGIYARYRRHRDNVTARPNWRITRDVLMTAWLSLCHQRGRYLKDWLHYFLVRPLRKRLCRRRHV